MDLESVKKLLNDVVSRWERRFRLHAEMEKRFDELFEGLSEDEREALEAVVREQADILNIWDQYEHEHRNQPRDDSPSGDDALPF